LSTDQLMASLERKVTHDHISAKEERKEEEESSEKYKVEGRTYKQRQNKLDQKQDRKVVLE